MKCYSYQMYVADSISDWVHGEMFTQRRLYIPEVGILGYGARKPGEIDFFSDSAESIEEGRKKVFGNLKKQTPEVKDCLEDTALDDLDCLRDTSLNDLDFLDDTLYDDTVFSDEDIATQKIQEIDLPTDTIYDFLKTYRQKKEIDDNMNIKAKTLISLIK